MPQLDGPTLPDMPGRVLVVTAREGLAAAIGRLSALAGTTCDLERDSSALRGSWRQAPLILVGGDVAVAVAAAGLPRRAGVVVVADMTPDTSCWQAALALGAHRLLALPDEESDLVDELRAADNPAGAAGRVVAVLGGCGGAGTSTFAAALALTAAKAGPTVLIDGDPLGGGLDVVLGAETTTGLRWGDFAGTRGRLDPQSFATALCQVGPIGLLAWARDTSAVCEAAAIDSVLDAAHRAYATVVLDLPRSWGTLSDRLLDASDATVLLVPAEVRPVAAAARLLAALGNRLVAPHLVVRDLNGGGLAPRDVGASLGLDVTATLRTDPAVRRAARRGELPVRGSRGALSRAGSTVFAALERQGSR